MKLNAKALAEKEAKKPATRESSEEGKEDSVVTPIQPSKKPSPPFILRKRAPMASALLPQDKEDEQDKALYEQERFRPINIPFDPEVHKNLLPVELSGFRVHMIVEQNQDASRIPKQIKEGLRNRKKEATDVELVFSVAMQKKMTWFQFHKEHIRPIYRFDKRIDGTQINVLGQRFSKCGAGVYDCTVVDHFLQVKTPWFKYRIRIGNAAERTYFKWSNFATVLKTPVASDAVFYTFYHGLHRYDNGWWIVAKHFNRIGVDYDMDIAEDTANYKAKMEAMKSFMIETDLGYSTKDDIKPMEESKKRKFMM